MPNELWIAGAGSGKTHKIITESVEAVRRGERVLVGAPPSPRGLQQGLLQRIVGGLQAAFLQPQGLGNDDLEALPW